MTDTAKKEMTLRVESSWGSIILVAQDDAANDWLDEHFGLDDDWSRTCKETMRWQPGRHDSLDRIFEDFMREGGVIG